MNFSEDKNYYQILGVEKSASDNDVIEAYCHKITKTHKYLEKEKIEEAYEVLHNNIKRKQYDNFLESLNNIESNELQVVNLAQLKQESEIKNTLIKGGKSVLELTTATTIVIVDFTWNLLKKCKIKLQKGFTSKKVKKFQTEESRIIEQYNKTLEENIEKCLKEKHNNYYLDINRLRYQNQIKLIKKLIEHKMNEQTKGNLSIKMFKIIALRTELESAQRVLENIKKKIDEYSNLSKISTTNKNYVM